MGLGAVLEPAASARGDGYIITSRLAEFLRSAAGLLAPSGGSGLYPPMEAGMLLRNPDLAAVLRDISRSGISGFYRGEIAAAIVAAIGGGTAS